jgi:hypothetical protein
MSTNSSTKAGTVTSARCNVTVNGSEASLGSDLPTAFSAMTLN